MIVALDTMTLSWAYLRKPTLGEEYRLLQMDKLINHLDQLGSKLLIPSPTMAEVLTATEDEIRLLELFRTLVHDKKHIIADFDNAAAFECARLRQRGLTDSQRIYAQEHGITKTRIKFDQMIAAIAIVNQVNVLYSEDKWIHSFASPYVTVKHITDLPERAAGENELF